LTRRIAQGERIYLRGAYDTARAVWIDALDRSRSLHDSLAEARTLTWLGLAAWRQGDYRTAHRLGEAALELKRRLARDADLFRSYNALGLLAWNEGRRLLGRAIDERLDFALETTLGASTIPALLAKAAAQGAEIWLSYVGLDSPERHLARVKARVAAGGHDIPEADIRRRWDASRANLVALMPRLARLRVYDNSAEADPGRGLTPAPRLLLHCVERKIVAPTKLRSLLADTPQWAKPIVAAALDLHLKRR
jgi:tetratricopeptide (TPR) repeat protein